MRDLFQVVFALKRKEIELAKQHLEKNCLYNSPLFSDSSSNKVNTTCITLKNTLILIYIQLYKKTLNIQECNTRTSR